MIIVDTREQKPLFTKDVEIKKLEVGDYSIKGYEDKIAIERKSPGDLFGTLGQGHKRFKAELARAMKYEYFAIVVDAPYDKVRDKLFPGAEYIKMSGRTVMKIVFTLHVKYGIPVFFARTRAESKAIIKSIFEAYEKQKEATQ